MESNVYQAVESIAEDLSSSGPFPKSPDFVQMACWADDLKSFGLEAMEGWHFINQVYDPTNYPVARWPIQDENVEVLIRQLDSTVKKMNRSPAWDLNFALANLVHFYGDIHQPLHATELFSQQYPDGDRGGNAQNVTVDGTQTVLHFVWDAICWEYSAELSRPLSSSNLAIVQNFGTYLMNTYSFTSSQKSEFNSTVMALESYNDAIQYAYPGTYSGMTISAAYLARCKPVAEARVALAGYRLASELNYLFKDSGDLTKEEHKTAMAKRIRERLIRKHVAVRNTLADRKEELSAARRNAMRQ
eukprot:CAMPEP_0176425022 /NCGR_PEP_ID=MMETSP0127-20121128/11166_1 /TAXON_ID=938130 /ORGANISM="Platyophrya macrostoma, Strain WH" /LENGTH=301 /DNA_ID=CAMNT_0017806153 /DNA_START=132 /DNA_END=1037 /DNA_ORIENTATION=-